MANTFGRSVVTAGIKKLKGIFVAPPAQSTRNLIRPQAKPTPTPLVRPDVQVPAKAPHMMNKSQRAAWEARQPKVNADIDAANRASQTAADTANAKIKQSNINAAASTKATNAAARKTNRETVNKNSEAAYKAHRNKLITGLGLVGAAYALTRPKAESTAPVAAPTRTAQTPAPTPVVERRTIASYYPVKEKKVGLMQNVKSAIVGDRKSSSTERQSLSRGQTKPAGRDASSGNASRPSNYRKSDSRLGGFGGRKSKGADAGATPRAAVDYSSPVWSGQTPVNFADVSSYGGKATQAPAPAVRTPVSTSEPALSYRGRRTRSDTNKPAPEPKAAPTRQGRQAKTTYTPGANTSTPMATGAGGKGTRGQNNKTAKSEVNPTRKGRTRNVPGDKEPKAKRTTGRRRES